MITPYLFSAKKNASLPYNTILIYPQAFYPAISAAHARLNPRTRCRSDLGSLACDLPTRARLRDMTIIQKLCGTLALPAWGA